MKNHILIILLLLFSRYSVSQTWQWATSAGGPNGESLISSCVDNSGNLYFTGGFSSSSYFGNDTLSSSSDYSSFLAKLDASGNHLWAVKAGGDDPSPGAGARCEVFYDSYDNSLVVSSRMSGLNQAVGNCTPYQGQPEQSNYHLTKLDTDGNCVWTVNYGDEFVTSLIGDGVGNLYLIMRVVPGGSMFNGEFLSEGRYLVKLKSVDGSVVWNVRILDFSYSFPKIAYQGGKLWIAGNTGTGTTFSFAGSSETTFPNDVFVAQLDTSTSVQWLKTYGGEGIDGTAHLGVDNEGNLYISGEFGDEAFFDDTSLTATNDNDLFLMKLNGQGHRLWLKRSVAVGNVNYYSGISDSIGNSVLCGKFSGTITFDPYTVTANDESGLVVKYDSAGLCVGVKTIPNIATGRVIPTIDHEASTLVAGSFAEESNFDGIIVTSVDGGYDVFVAKIDLKTGVPEARFDGNNELFIYANPNEGKCTIDVPDDFLYENNLILRIFDNSGKLIRQTPLNMNQGRIQLSLEQEAKGIYTATLSNSEKSYHGRIVFE